MRPHFSHVTGRGGLRTCFCCSVLMVMVRPHFSHSISHFAAYVHVAFRCQARGFLYREKRKLRKRTTPSPYTLQPGEDFTGEPPQVIGDRTYARTNLRRVLVRTMRS